jgi:precorrin-3B synthase
MASGDGLIARVRPRAGRFAADDLRTIAMWAATFGNGLIDVTSRGNVQIRGLKATDLSTFGEAMHESGLVERTPEREQARIVVLEAGAALTRADVRLMATEIEAALVALAIETGPLPAKFCVGIERSTGPSMSLAADIMVRVSDDGAALVHPSGTTLEAPVATKSPDMPRRVADIVRWFQDVREPHETRMAHMLARLRPEMVVAPAAREPLPDPDLLELGVAFGSMDHALLRHAAELAERFGCGYVAPTCRRGLLIRCRGESTEAQRMAVAAGFVRQEDPLLRIAACSGRPACTSAHADVRGDARRLLALAQQHDIRLPKVHLSGCAKGCAHPQPAEWCLTATEQGYDLARNAVAGEAAILRGLSVTQAYQVIARNV